MTGWRVGFLFGSSELVGVATMLQSQSTTGTSSVSQWAALAAFEHAAAIQPEIRSAMEARRNLFFRTMEDVFGYRGRPPQAGLYAFLPLSAFGAAGDDDSDFCRTALEKKNVALVPGSAFGAPGFVRASFGGKEEEFVAGLRALEEKNPSPR
jgi:aspartate/methionine/tyrosine aminotransferase